DGAQMTAIFVTHHLQQAQRRLARRQGQIIPRGAVTAQDLELAVDQHRGWYMLGQQNIAGDLFRVLWSPRIASVYAVVCGRRHVARAVWGREIHAVMAAGGEPAVYPVLPG